MKLRSTRQWLLSLAMLLATACGGGQAKPNAMTAASAAERQVVACIRGGDVTDLPPGVAATGVTEDSVVIVQGPDAAFRSLRAPWRLVVRFGAPDAYAKVQNPRAIIAAPEDGFEALLKLSVSGAALDDDALRAKLAGAGFKLATRTGEVVTGHAALETLEVLLALDTVAALRASARMR